MKLESLLQLLPNKTVDGSVDRQVESLAVHSAKAGPESLFVAVPGARADGHDFLQAAYAAGARMFVSQKPFARPDATSITVPDSRAALSALAAAFCGDPSKRMQLIGITGTNGKTTTAFLIESIIRRAGRSPGMLSTVEYRFRDKRIPAERTTPDPIALQGMLKEMAAEGIDCAVMEVSSHGLDQRRAEGCHFDAGIFTNLSPEHLDYHGSMEDYYLSKERFFTEVLPASSKPSPVAVINRDDPAGKRMLLSAGVRTVDFGLEHGEVRAREVIFSLEGIRGFLVAGSERFAFSSPLIGKFNLYNILAAAAAAHALGIEPETIRAGIAAAQAVPGRLERIDNDRGVLIFVDYAHTGDALENVLIALRQLGAENIITIFGCGGDRDRGKRPVMGRIAAQYSSVVVLTSDNPRSEDPGTIIREIEAGVVGEGFSRSPDNSLALQRKKNYFVFSDRREAIRGGIAMAEPGDVILIAGKGHETSQQVGEEKTHFDDREEVRRALQKCA